MRSWFVVLAILRSSFNPQSSLSRTTTKTDRLMVNLLECESQAPQMQKAFLELAGSIDAFSARQNWALECSLGTVRSCQH